MANRDRRQPPSQTQPTPSQGAARTPQPPTQASAWRRPPSAFPGNTQVQSSGKVATPAPTPQSPVGVNPVGAVVPRPFNTQQPNAPQATTVFQSGNSENSQKTTVSNQVTSAHAAQRRIGATQLSQVDEFTVPKHLSTQEYLTTLQDLRRAMRPDTLFNNQKIRLGDEIFITDTTQWNLPSRPSNLANPSMVASTVVQIAEILQERNPQLAREFGLQNITPEKISEWGGREGQAVFESEFLRDKNLYELFEAVKRTEQAAARTVEGGESEAAFTAYAQASNPENTQTDTLPTPEKTSIGGALSAEGSGELSDSELSDSPPGEPADESTEKTTEEAVEETTEEPKQATPLPKEPDVPEEPHPEDEPEEVEHVLESPETDTRPSNQEFSTPPNTLVSEVPQAASEITPPTTQEPGLAQSSISEEGAGAHTLPQNSPLPPTTQHSETSSAPPPQQTEPPTLNPQLAQYFEEQLKHDLFGAHFLPDDSVPPHLRQHVSEYVLNALTTLSPEELGELSVSSVRKRAFTESLTTHLAQSRFRDEVRSFYQDYIDHPEHYPPLTAQHRSHIQLHLQQALQNQHLLTEVGSRDPYQQLAQDILQLTNTDSARDAAQLTQLRNQLPAIILTLGPEEAYHFLQTASAESLEKALALPSGVLTQENLPLVRQRLIPLLSLKSAEYTLLTDSQEWRRGLLAEQRSSAAAGSRKVSQGQVARQIAPVAELAAESTEETAVTAVASRKGALKKNQQKLNKMLEPYWLSNQKIHGLIYEDLGLNPKAFNPNFKPGDPLPIPAGFFAYTPSSIEALLKKTELQEHLERYGVAGLSSKQRQEIVANATSLLAHSNDATRLATAEIIQADLQQELTTNLPNEQRAILYSIPPTLTTASLPQRSAPPFISTSPEASYQFIQDAISPEEYEQLVREFSPQELSYALDYSNNPEVYQQILAQSPEYGGLSGALRTRLSGVRQQRFRPREFLRNRIGNTVQKVRSAKKALSALGTAAKAAKASNPAGWVLLALGSKTGRKILAGTGLAATLALAKIPGWLSSLFGAGAKVASAASSFAGGGGATASTIPQAYGGGSTLFQPVQTGGTNVFQAFAGKAVSAASSAASSYAFVSVAGSLGFVVFVTILTLMVIQGAFLIPSPNGSQGRFPSQDVAASKYLTLSKKVTPNTLSNGIAQEVTYTVTISPKSLYTIRVTGVSDTITVYSEEPHSIPESPPIDPDAFQPGPHQAPISTSYSLTLSAIDALVLNAVEITYDAIDTTTGATVATGETLTASAAVIIGNPKVGCFVFLPPGTRLAGRTSLLWTEQDKARVFQAFMRRAGTSPTFISTVCSKGPVDMFKLGGGPYGGWTMATRTIGLYDNALSTDDVLEYTLIHELGHVIRNSSSSLDSGFAAVLRNRTCFTYPFPGMCASNRGSESFAEAISLYVIYKTYPFRAWGIYDFPSRDPIEYNWVKENIYGGVEF